MSCDIAEKIDKITQWMRDQAREAGADGGVFGVSGGVDSAVVAGLAKRAWGDKCLGLILPCHSIPEDREDAKLVVDAFGLPHKEIDLSQVFDLLVATFGTHGLSPRHLALSNLKPRLRMLTLYYHANLMNYIVVGTGNKDELYVGYFTKYGDGGCDILPLGCLLKSEVWEMARYLGVPARIIDKAPSAGLWVGQTDESEMGISYSELDAFLRGSPVAKDVEEKIKERHRRSAHKRRVPPIPEI